MGRIFIRSSLSRFDGAGYSGPPVYGDNRSRRSGASAYLCISREKERRHRRRQPILRNKRTARFPHDGHSLPSPTPLSGILPRVPAHGRETLEAPADSVRYRWKEVIITANRYEKNGMGTNLPVRSVVEDEIWSGGFATATEIASVVPGAAAQSSGPWTGRWRSADCRGRVSCSW